MTSTESKIVALLERILECVDKKPRAEQKTSPELEKDRRDILLKLFDKLAGLPSHLKQDQHFAKELIPVEGEPNISVVPLSILRNRCGHIKAFKPRSGEPALNAIFSDVLATTELVVATLAEGKLRVNSHTMCVWTKSEARKAGLLSDETARVSAEEEKHLAETAPDWLSLKPTLNWDDELQPEPDLESDKNDEEELESEIDFKHGPSLEKWR